MSRNIQINKIADLNKESYKKSEIPDFINYLDTGNLTRNKVENFKYFDTNKEKIPSRAQRKVKVGTIIYSTVRPNQEHYGIIEKVVDNLVVSTGFTTVDVIDKEIDAKYLFYLITQNHITEYLHSIGMNSVSSYPSISPNDIGNLRFRIPGTIQSQQSIAKVLADLDAKIELNNRVNTELEAMAKTLYDYWFVQFDFPFDFAQGKPSANGKPYKSSGGKMVYNEELKREIPEGWEVKPLADLCLKIGDGIHGTPEYVDKSDYTFINGNNLKNGFIHVDEETKQVSLEEYEKFYIELNEDTILLSINGTLGNLAVHTGEKVMLGKSAAYLNCTGKNRPYCYQFLKMDNIQKTFWNIATGSTIKNLSLDSLKNLLIPYPDSDLIEQFYQLLMPIDSKRKTIFLENQQLTALRDWLLPMLMNGQVGVGA